MNIAFGPILVVEDVPNVLDATETVHTQMMELQLTVITLYAW